MNAQEIFDKVATHLIQQGEPAMDSNGDCVYRNDQGLKCAVGCLIPDDKYEGRFEQLGIGANLSANKERQSDIEGLWSVLEGEGILRDEHLQLLEDLQEAHDGWEAGGVHLIIGALNYVADNHDLDPFVLEMSHAN